MTATATRADLQVDAAHSMSVEEVTTELDVASSRGLTREEAARRLEVVGANRLVETPPRPAWRVFVDQFRSALFLILLAAGILAAALGDVKDAAVIGVVVLLNAIIGFAQERKATRSLAALKQMLVQVAVVRRDGVVVSVPADELVPGDVVEVEAGARVPADGRVVAAHQVQADESSLTGESRPVTKTVDALPRESVLADRSNMLHAGAAVTRGRAEMVVVATGMNTQVGRIAGMLDATVVPRTPLQVQLDSVGRRVALLGVAAVLLYLAVAVLRGEELADIVLRGVALAVAAVPEGLPAVLALVLAAGVHRMAKHGAIVRRLASVETLGSATVVCTDKTGTLTRNQMTVREIVTLDSDARSAADRERLLVAFTLCSDAALGEQGAVGDPMEVGLLHAAQQNGLDVDAVRSGAPRTAEVPFDASRKFMATLHARENTSGLLAVKGAPDVLLSRCDAMWQDGAEVTLGSADKQDVAATVDRMAAQGLRILAAAERGFTGEPGELTEDRVTGLVLLGLVGIADPPREEAADAVAVCHRAGIDVKMITGDHVRTAAAIAGEIGIRGRAVTGGDLDLMTEEQLKQQVGEIGVFARVTPEHKVAIVSALTRRGDVVSMTGDGVNDAAALRAAHVGVAMGRTGTDVTKEAADVVLTDDNFATIVGAVRQGRGIYDNIVKFVRFQLTTNIAAILSFVVAVLAGLPAPMTAVQVLWVNLITDGPPALALGVDRTSREVMDRGPRPPGERILSAQRLVRMLGIGLVMVTGTLGALVFVDADDSPGRATTLAFTTFVLLQVVNALHVRTEFGSLFSRDLPLNRWLLLSLALVVGLQVAVVHAPVLQAAFDTVALRPSDWAYAVGVALAGLLSGEVEKAVRRSMRRHRQPREAWSSSSSDA